MKITIIDDEPDICFLLALELKSKGHQVSTFELPEEAMRSFSQDGLPDLVVCDFKMPKKSGLDVYKSLKDQGYNKPFYLLTGELSMDQKVLEDIGITEIFYKPDDLVRLIDRLNLNVN